MADKSEHAIVFGLPTSRLNKSASDNPLDACDFQDSNVIDWGIVSVGQHVRTLSVSNNLNCYQCVAFRSSSKEFKINEAPFVLEPFASIEIQLIFTAEMVGLVAAEIEFVSLNNYTTRFNLQAFVGQPIYCCSASNIFFPPLSRASQCEVSLLFYNSSHLEITCIFSPFVNPNFSVSNIGDNRQSRFLHDTLQLPADGQDRFDGQALLTEPRLLRPSDAIRNLKELPQVINFP